ncbi:MAG: hypothetical protein IJZ74_01525 [Clostridia bacterium]|nr:hypothetical protein [Clostridia bacterium]
MDNQFNQPGAGYPPQSAGQMPMGGMPPQDAGMYPPVGYMPPNGMGQPQGYAGMPQQGYPDMTGQYAAGQPYQGSLPQGYAEALQQQTGYQQPYQNTGYQQQMGYPAYQQQPYGEAGYEHLFDPNQPVMAEQHPAGFPPQERKPVRPRLHLNAFHFAIILVALGFMGWYLYSQLAPEAAQYGTIALGSLSASHSGDSLIVRNESPYDAEGVTSIVYDADEGSSVVRNDYICKVYSSGYSTREMKTLQDYRAEIRDYQKDLIESETTYDARMTRVTSDVLTRAKEVRDLIGGARGSLANQEKLLGAAVEARQQYLKQKYTSDQRYSRLYDDELSQSQRIDSWTKQYTAKSDGIVSFYSDGYEYGLSGTNYTAFEPREVRAMINGQKPELTTLQKGKTTIYRMVRDGEWYVLFLSDDTSWNPVNGQVYELQLERFENTQVMAEVVSFTRSGGELLVRLKVTGDVKPVLYMRTCEAVLGESLTTLMVNERAIYVQDGMTGVVVVEGQTESFIPVNVIRYADGNAYFQAIQQGLLFENMTVRLF